MSHPEKSELLFLHEEDFFGKIPPGKAVFDMTLEDYMASARIHAVAVRGECDVDGEEAPRAVLRRAAVSRSDVAAVVCRESADDFPGWRAHARREPAESDVFAGEDDLSVVPDTWDHQQDARDGGNGDS